MKLRLHGIPAEVAVATSRLVQVLEVVAVSPPYPDRGASVLVRVYLEVRLDTLVDRGTPGAPPDPSAQPPRAGRRRPGEVTGR